MVLQPVHSACCEYGAAKGQDVLIEHDAGVVHGFAVEFILLAGHGTQQHCGVQIVAAAVHGAGDALEGQTGLLLKGQSIHIGPEQNGLAGAAALDGGGQRAVGQLLRALAILDQFFLYKGFGPGQLLPHFCILMKGVPHLHQLRLESKGLLIDLVHKIKLLLEKTAAFYGPDLGGRGFYYTPVGAARGGNFYRSYRLRQAAQDRLYRTVGLIPCLAQQLQCVAFQAGHIAPCLL